MFARQVIESEFNAVSVDLKPAFFESLNKDGRVNESSIIIDSLANSYGSLQKQVLQIDLNIFISKQKVGLKGKVF